MQPLLIGPCRRPARCGLRPPALAAASHGYPAGDEPLSLHRSMLQCALHHTRGPLERRGPTTAADCRRRCRSPLRVRQPVLQPYQPRPFAIPLLTCRVSTLQ